MAENLGFPRKNKSGWIGKLTRMWEKIFVEKLVLNGVEYALPAADGAAGQQLTTDGSGTLSWAAAGAGLTTAWDDISNPDASKTIIFGTNTQLFTSAVVGADGFTFRGTGNFGDISIVKIESLTGTPTDGTVLEVVSHNTNADPLVVTVVGGTKLQVTGAGNVEITGGTGALTYTDWSITSDAVLTLSPDDSPAAVIVVSPTAAATTGIDLTSANLTNAISIGSKKILGTTAVIDFTNFDVDAAGAVTCSSLSAGTIKMDSIVPASAAPTTLLVNGAGGGGITIGGVSTGTITLGGGSTLVNLPANTDLTLAGGVISVTDTANATALGVTNNTITNTNLLAIASSSLTSGKMLSLVGGAAVSGAIIYAQATDGAGFTGKYIECYDGTEDDFSVARYGVTTIAGNAATDVLVLTAGDLQITAGAIDVDNGNVTVNTSQDLASNITRDFAGVGGGPVLTVKDDNTASTNVALQVTQDGTAGTALGVTATGTGNSTGVSIAHSGDLPAINITAGAARTGDVIAIAMANQLGQRAINITGAMTSVAGGGVIEIHGTGVIPATASLLRLDADTAQPGDGDGWCMNVDDDTLVVATPSKYAVLIDSNANEALHVATGKSLFDETATFTAGLNVDGDIDIDLATNANLVNINHAAVDLAAGAGVVTVYGSGGAGQTNAAYLLRLAWVADGDAQDNFILCQDNSSGAAANGDEKFKVDTGGAMTVAGTSTLNGKVSLGTQTELTIAAGAITVTRSYHTVDTTGDVASSDLETINGGIDGMILVLQANNSARTVVVKNNVGNILCGADFSLDNVADTITLLYDGTNSKWVKISSSDNAA
jgi:hypothetical protein